MGTFSFVLGALVLQFTVVSQFASAYAQIIKTTLLAIVALYGVLLILVTALSFMASALLPLLKFQTRSSSFLFSLFSFAQFRSSVSLDAYSQFY